MHRHSRDMYLGGGVLRCVAANGGDVDHAVAEFDESTSWVGEISWLPVQLERVKWERRLQFSYTHLLRGISKSAIYRNTKFANRLYFSSPSHLMKLLLGKCSPKRMAVSPFSAKQKSNRSTTVPNN